MENIYYLPQSLHVILASDNAKQAATKTTAFNILIQLTSAQILNYEHCVSTALYKDKIRQQMCVRHSFSI